MTSQVFHDLYEPRIHLRKGALGGLRSEGSYKRSTKSASKQATVMLIKTDFSFTDS